MVTGNETVTVFESQLHENKARAWHGFMQISQEEGRNVDSVMLKSQLSIFRELNFIPRLEQNVERKKGNEWDKWVGRKKNKRICWINMYTRKSLCVTDSIAKQHVMEKHNFLKIWKNKSHASHMGKKNTNIKAGQGNHFFAFWEFANRYCGISLDIMENTAPRMSGANYQLTICNWFHFYMN